MVSGSWIRVSQAAEELGLSSQAVRDLIRGEKLDGAKDPEGRWLITEGSFERYLAEHGRRKPAPPGLDQVGRRLDELASTLQQLSKSNSLAERALEATARERDKYRADVVAVREASLQLLASAHDTHTAVSGLLSVMQRQQAALMQLLTPGTLDDLAPLDLERTSGST